MAREVVLARHVGHVETVALGVELPAVIGATQPAFLVAAKKQRGAAMWAAMVEDADLPGAVAERDQLFAEQHQPQRGAVRLELRRQTGRDPVLPQQRAHRCAGADPGEEFVFGCGGHVVALQLGQSSAQAPRQRKSAALSPASQIIRRFTAWYPPVID